MAFASFSLALLIAAMALACVVSYVLSRVFAARHFLVDSPNERSSHEGSASRAGGFAIYGGFVLAAAIILAIDAFHGRPLRFAPAVLIGAAAFVFGAADDRRAISARTKLIIQIAIAGVFVACYGPVRYIPWPFGGAIELGLFAIPLTMLWIVAVMNVFNFMDGANGLAAAAAMFILCGLSIATAFRADAAPFLALALASALLGFLPVNLIGGRIFMGDSGSQSVGFLLAAFAVLGGNGGEGASRLFAPIAFLPFIIDTAFTLGHRLLRGRNVLTAHNEHAYQLLMRMGRSHVAVTTIYLTLIVISTATALAVNLQSASVQYGAAASLAAAFLALAVMVYRRARRAGLLDEGRAAQIPGEAASAASDEDARLAAAAE